jgi:enoyl-[acyl-carrier protein] reductase I
VLGGKVDFVLHSIGMSPNVRKGRSYGDLNYEWFQKSLDISALSFHKMLQVAEKLDAINEWGSVVALTYIASQRTFRIIPIWRRQRQYWNLLPAVMDTGMEK